MQIEVNTTTATLIPPRESLTPGSVNAVQLQFSFSDEWNGLTKTCVFSNEIETVPAEIQNDATSVPEEILDEVYRWISVGVSGEDAEGTVIIPTIWCRIGQCLPGVSGRFVTIDMLQAYWSKQEIDLHTDGDGSKFLGDDGVYHSVAQGGGDEKTFVAEYGVTTAQEIIAFADATKEPFAPILVKRGVDYYTVTTVSKQAANKVILVTFASLSGNYYTFTYTITDGTWASSSYGFQKLLESGVNIKTIGGQSLLGSGDIPVQGLSQVQADWNEADTTSPAYIQNKPTIPDVSDLATKDELAAAVEPLATKTELANATAGLATTVAMNAALALKADKSELNSYARQYDVNQALATKADKTELGNYATKSEIITVTDGDGTQFLANDGTYKRVQTDLSSYLTKTEAEQTYATQTEVADKADKSEIITVTTGTGTLFLADDGTYKPAAGDPPDLSAYLTKTEAGATYETQTHAAETYATKVELPDTSDMLTKTEAASTYATQSELSDKADTTTVNALDTRVTANEGAITALQNDKADASALADYETTAHSAATYATKAELPDTSDMLTKTEAESTYATIEAHNTLALRVVATESEISAMKSENYLPSATAEATYATKAEIPDVSGFETTAHAEATYATKTELADKADASAVDSALALKADKTELASYETTEHASATYATKTELTEGLAGKVDTADIADMLTKTEAEGTYADKVSLLALENTVEAQRTRITNLETNKADKTEIITVTNGTGTLFLADDGTYKPAAGDPPDLSAYLTKTEAGTTYATQIALTEGLAGKVDTATLADYETIAHASATYATKAELPDVSDMLTKTEAGTTYATKTELADKADSATVTALSGVVTGHTAEISALQTTKADKSEIPDVSGFETTAHAEATYAKKTELPDVSDMLTKTEAGTTYATQTALTEGLAGKVDTATLADYETIAHASATYATKAELPDVSDMLTKTEAGTTYATKTELADKADASALADYETTAHAAATYETKADASQVKSITAAGFAVTPDASGNVNVGGTDVSRATTSGSWGSEITYTIAQTLPAGATSDTKGSSLSVIKRTENSGATPRVIMTVDGVQLATSADIPDVSHFATTDYVQNTFESTAHASATYLKIADAASTYATKAELPDVSDMLTKTEAGTTYATQTALTEGLAGKVDTATLDDYETTAHASATYATKAEIPDVSGFETTAHAAATYQTIADASPIKSITDGTIALTPDTNGNVKVGRTAVRYLSLGTNPPYTNHGVVISEDAPSGAGAGEGAAFGFSYQTDGTELTEAKVAMGDAASLTYMDLPTKKWVREYIASLDGNNIGY